MSSQTRTTTDHDEIRKWVEDHDGRPATVSDTAAAGDEAGVLRIDFPGGDSDLETIGWEDWFEKFDREKLALLYQAEKTDGSDSTFCKLVQR